MAIYSLLNCIMFCHVTFRWVPWISWGIHNNCYWSWNIVKHFFKIIENHSKGFLLLSALFLDLSHGENHINGSSVGPETTLISKLMIGRFGRHPLSHQVLWDMSDSAVESQLRRVKKCSCHLTRMSWVSVNSVMMSAAFKMDVDEWMMGHVQHLRPKGTWRDASSNSRCQLWNQPSILHQWRTLQQDETTNAWVTQFHYADDNCTLAYELKDLQNSRHLLQRIQALKTHHQHRKY